MKKILFRKILIDCFNFFLISILGASVIVWVFQSVNFLDIIVEDGRDYVVYLKYSILNFPKIISRILPFAIFFSFSYVLTKYELNNELITLWNFGVHKLSLINFLLYFSFLITIFQILLTVFVVPYSQNLSRNLIKSSNVDFFESFVKPKKFNDNINGLTIYVDEKNSDGILKNIYLKKDTGGNNFQITYAKSGYFLDKKRSKILLLENGETINKTNNKINNFSFKTSEFNMSEMDSGVIKDTKIQETSTKKLAECLIINSTLKLFKNYNSQNQILENCTTENLQNVFKELYKRVIIPLYLPILILISSILITFTKENINYSKYKFYIFLLGILIIIVSETSIRLIKLSFLTNLTIIFLPLIILISLYLLIYKKLDYKFI